MENQPNIPPTAPLKASSTDWLTRLIQSPVVDAVVERLDGPRGDSPRRVVAKGSQGSTAPLFASAVALRLKRPVLLVVAHLDDADDALDDLDLAGKWAAARGKKQWSCRRFGAMEVLPGESTINVELLAERLAAVEMLGRLRASGEGNFRAKPQAG